MKKLSSLPRLSWLFLPTLLGFASCNRQDASSVQAAEEVSSLEKTKTRLESELKTLRVDFEKRQAEIIQKNDELLKSNDELKAQFEKAQDEAAKVKREYDEYVSKYKVSLRAKAKGLELPRLEMADKTVYEAVVVKEVTPKDVAIAHAGGIAHVRLADLPVELQRKFLYDPEEVKAIEAEEAAAAAAVKDLPEVAGVKMRDPKRAVNPIAVRNLRNRIVSRETEVGKAEKEALEVKKSSYANTNIAQYRVKQLGQRAARLRNDIAALRALLERELNGPQSAGGPSSR